ncbi:MAG: hypothetical protein ACE5F6_01900 [Anaerolineae bacterium]
MMRRVTLCGAVLLTAVILLLAGVQGLVWAQGGGGCPAGDTNYYPDCDVSQDGQINIEDLQRVAARWKVNSPTGTWSGHFGDTWSGSGAFGLKVQNSASGGVGLWGDGSPGVKATSSGGTGLYASSLLGSAARFENAGSRPTVVITNTAGTNFPAVQATGYTTGAIVTGREVGLVGIATITDTLINGGVNGVFGRSDGMFGAGVVGYATQDTGVYGASDGKQGIGVYGVAATGTGFQTYAGYFAGDVSVTGLLFKGGGSFKIDHPLDPARKYLYHSFVESPDMKNIYDGVAKLDANGEAWVQLPGWFEALNQDFRYQLTAIGASMPGLYIAQEVQDNRFRIAGGVPGAKVSWQVTGIRHDPFAEQNRIPVEEEKPAAEQGTYLYPAGYGQPGSKGLDYQRRRQLFQQHDLQAEPVAAPRR